MRPWGGGGDALCSRRKGENLRESTLGVHVGLLWGAGGVLCVEGLGERGA